MRALFITNDFSEFLENADQQTKDKIAYLSNVITTQTVINTNIGLFCS